MPQFPTATTVFDTGLYHSYVLLVAAGLPAATSVFAFEMNPKSASMTESSFSLNRHPNQVLQVVNVGVGAIAQQGVQVERSHRMDIDEFDKLLDGVVMDDSVRFNNKLQEWEDFYNFH